MLKRLFIIGTGHNLRSRSSSFERKDNLLLKEDVSSSSKNEKSSKSGKKGVASGKQNLKNSLQSKSQKSNDKNVAHKGKLLPERPIEGTQSDLDIPNTIKLQGGRTSAIASTSQPSKHAVESLPRCAALQSLDSSYPLKGSVSVGRKLFGSTENAFEDNFAGQPGIWIPKIKFNQTNSLADPSDNSHRKNKSPAVLSVRLKKSNKLLQFQDISKNKERRQSSDFLLPEIQLLYRTREAITGNPIEYADFDENELNNYSSNVSKISLLNIYKPQSHISVEKVAPLESNQNPLSKKRDSHENIFDFTATETKSKMPLKPMFSIFKRKSKKRSDRNNVSSHLDLTSTTIDNNLCALRVKTSLGGTPLASPGRVYYTSSGTQQVFSPESLQRLLKVSARDSTNNSTRLISRSEPRLFTSSTSKSLDLLRPYIQETKYVTAVFESASGGLGAILDDVKTELAHWLGSGSRLLAVACEVHWSVPECFRSRALEIELKECLHAALRNNNHRVLNLYDEWRSGGLQFSVTKSKTEESCARDSDSDAFQGIYRRYYPHLLTLQDSRTAASHKSYWAIEPYQERSKTTGSSKIRNSVEVRNVLVPQPAKFLHHRQLNVLNRLSLVALNLAVLRLRGDQTVYDGHELINSRLVCPANLINPI